MALSSISRTGVVSISFFEIVESGCLIFSICHTLTIAGQFYSVHCLYFQGAPDFLGRAMTYPQVNLDASDSAPAILQWCSISKGQIDGGELLFAAELFLVILIDSNTISSFINSFDHLLDDKGPRGL